MKTIDAEPEVQAVVITKWQYLEDDMSSIDIKRRKAYYSRQNRRKLDVDFASYRDLVGATQGTAVPGSIKNAFEQRATTLFDSILSVEEAWKAIKGHPGARASLAAQKLHSICVGIGQSRRC